MAETLTEEFPPLDYTSRDQESIYADLKDRIPYYFSEWTDQNETDLGIWLLRLFSGLADVLHWNIDRMASEAFLPTAITRASVINLLKLIDYTPDSATPSTVDLTFTLVTAYAGDVTVTAGTECQVPTSGTEEPVYFETDVDLVIVAGLQTGTVAATEGQTVSEDVGLSDGTRYQEYILSGETIIAATIAVYIDEGAGEELWTQTTSFAGYGPTEKIYTVELTSDGSYKILFGDNGSGKVPDNNATIRAEYRQGGGTRGNVGAASITEINDPIFYTGHTISVSVTNTLSASGGLDAETIEDSKRKGPRSLRTRFGLITEEDYAFAAEEVDGVAKAVAEGEGYRIINIYIAPGGGGMPSTLLKQDVLDYCNTRKIVTTEVLVWDPTYVDIDMTGIVYVLSNYTQADVEAVVLAAVTSMLDFEERDFSEDVFRSDVYAVIDNTEGVDHVDLTELTIVPVVVETLWSGDAVVGTFVITATTDYETWTVEFTSGSTFTVTGAVAGLQVNTGTIDVAYLVDDSSFGFTITSGVVSPVTGDNATVRASKLLDNITILAKEIAQEGTTTLTFSGGA